MERSATIQPSARRKKTEAGDAAVQPALHVFTIRSIWAAIGLTVLSLGFQSLVYPPLPLWPLVFLCLVPWVLVVVGSPHAKFVYFISYLLGFGFFLINLYWMYYPTGLGQVALSAYLAAYFPVMACALRHSGRRRRIPMALALPAIWVGAEVVRALLVSGFPWFLLAHSAYKFLSLIQISDVTGAYGVSFVIAAINGAVADIIMRGALRGDAPPAARSRARRETRRARPWPLDTLAYGARQARFSMLWTVGLLLLTLLYGQIQLHRRTQSNGPRIAILQGDFLNFVDRDDDWHPLQIRDFYFGLMQSAQSQHPDLYLLPESPWLGLFLNSEFLARDPAGLPHRWRPYQEYSRDSFERFRAQAQHTGAFVVTGGTSMHYDPFDLLETERRYNSAFIFAPDPGAPAPLRYDKVHVVPFGETIPFRFGRLRFLYLWFNDMSPFGQNGEYSIWPGSHFETFTMHAASQNQRGYRFAVPICYEDVMPYVARRFAAGSGPLHTRREKQIDFLLNISNDGWFMHSNELVQHLAIAVFRAVENRVGIARAVNTGVSAFIDSNGRIQDTIPPATKDYRVAPVSVDTRFAIYSRYGDVFATTCAAIGALLLMDYTLARIRGHPASPA